MLLWQHFVVVMAALLRLLKLWQHFVVVMAAYYGCCYGSIL